MSNPIDLAQPRTVVLRDGARTHEYTLRRITQDLWFKYFDGIVSTALREGKQIVQSFDASSAGIELVESAVESAHDRFPLAHRLGVANVLTSAFVPDEDMRGFGEIPLIAIWGVGEKGSMLRHKDLLHVFEEPSAEQYRRFKRDDSRSQIIGGSRKGTTLYHGAQRTLAALYDELIVRVEGYVVSGVELDGRDAIASNMDAYHKVAAMARVFAPQQIDIEDEDEEES